MNHEIDPARRGLIADLGAAAALAASPASAQQGAAPPGLFAGRVVLVTEATSGIGEGTAHAFAREGAKVAFCGRREALGQAVQDAIRAEGGEATYVRADVREEGSVARLVAETLRLSGRLDVAFNNAGIETPTPAPLHGQPLADFDDVMRTNAYGVFLSMKHELPAMLANAPQGAFGTRGVIVNNASTSGHVGWATIGPYSASKHAILGLTKCAALEASPLGVRVASLSPGAVDTPMLRRFHEAQGLGRERAPASNLSLRTNTVAEMAEVVMFLASDAASSITGADLDVTGGFHHAGATKGPRDRTMRRGRGPDPCSEAKAHLGAAFRDVRTVPGPVG